MEEKSKEETIVETEGQGDQETYNEKEEKFKKKVIALTVGAVLLMVILLGVLIWQLIAIGIRNSEIKKLDERIAYYQSLTDEEKGKIEVVSLRDYIVQEAYKLGYKLPDDLD